MAPRCAALVLTILAAVPASRAEQPDDRDPFAPLARQVDALREVRFTNATDAEKDRVQDLWASMNRDLGDLRERAKGRAEEIPDAYRKTLAADELALKRVHDPKLENGQKVKICEGVARDLSMKRTHAIKIPKAMFKSVKVTVRCVDGTGAEVNNVRVWFVVQGWWGSPDHYGKFDNLSNPKTTQDVPPGGYFMWTKFDNQDPTGERQPVDVGGAPEKTLDLTTPS